MEQIIAAKPPMGEGEQRGRNKIKDGSTGGERKTQETLKKKKKGKK